MQRISTFIFYFDLIGVVDDYVNDPTVIDRIVDWQRQVRGEVPSPRE